jgi:hypothetical protein
VFHLRNLPSNLPVNVCVPALRRVVSCLLCSRRAADYPPCSFAGAGLFDSFPTTPTVPVMIDYTREPMAWDKTAASALLWTAALAAVAAEGVLQQEHGTVRAASTGDSAGLDVEGCITTDGSVWLLQARPQV